MYNPETKKTKPFEEYEAGKLREGNGNPDSEDYNSLSDFAWSNDKKTVEIRIPWLLLNFRDPSRKEVTADIIANESIYKSDFIENLGLSFLWVENGETKQSLPAKKGDEIPKMKRYSWENWDRIETTPRLKKSYDILRDYFATVE